MSRLKKGKTNNSHARKKTNVELRKRVLKLNKTNVEVGKKKENE